MCHGLRFAAFGRLPPMSPRWKGRPRGAFSQNETGDCLTVDKQGPREAHDDNSVLIEPSGSHVHPARSGRPTRLRVVLQERTSIRE